MLRLITSDTNTIKRVPFIPNDILDDYAQDILYDAMPDRLKSPEPVGIEKFLEFYLGLNVVFKQIRYDRKILGLTAFNDGYVKVVDERTGKIVSMWVTAGTVILDTSLAVKRNERYLRFTCAHEGSHWLLHRDYFKPKNICRYDSRFDNQFLAAAEGYVDYKRLKLQKTDLDRMEWQANFLASALLMSRPALRIAYRNFFHSFGLKPRKQIIRGASEADMMYEKLLPEDIASKFNVSKRAAAIRLEKLYAIVDN